MNASRSVPVLVMVLLALSGCSKASKAMLSLPTDSPSPTDSGRTDLLGGPSPTLVKPTTAVDCGSVTAAQVNAALGTLVGAPNINRSNPPVSVCTYSGGTPFRTVIVRAQGGQDAAGFALEKEAFNRNGQTTTDVPGYGDEAYSSVLTAGSISVSTLVARKGDVEILITSRSTLDQIGLLMGQVLVKV